MDVDPLTLPYAERQLITVADEAIVQAEREAAAQTAAKASPEAWVEVAIPIFTRIIVGPVVAWAVEKAIETMKARQRLREAGFRVLGLSRKEAASLQFPPGHPRDGVLYVGHPTSPKIYFTIAQFHRVTFEHKFVEAVRLLTSLGATEVVVEHVSGWSHDFSATLAVPLTAVPGDIGASAGAQQKKSASLLFKGSYRNKVPPSLPTDLVWYPHEPTWQAIASGRLDHGLSDFSLTVRYEDDFGVNAGLKMSAANAGLDVGGRFEDHVSTVWRIEGKFAEPLSGA